MTVADYGTAESRISAGSREQVACAPRMRTWRRETLLAAGALLLAFATAGPASAAPAYDLAGRCVAIKSLDGGPFHLKATGLGTYLLNDKSGQVVTDTLARSGVASAAAQWAIARSGAMYDLRATANGQKLGPDPLAAATGCTPFPEAEV